MVRGRKPKPSAQKVLEGNPGKRPLNKREPTFAPAAAAPPDWLDERAKEEWARLAPAMLAQRLLTVADRTLFAAYCRAYSRWRQAEEIVERSPTMVFRTPTGYVQQIPHVGIAHRYLDQMRALAAEFGFTPATRARMAVDPAGKGKDPHADFFGFGGSKPNGTKGQGARTLH